MAEIIKIGEFSFSFPIAKESEICKDSWGEDITDSLDRLNDNAFCKSYLYKAKELTTYESCKIEGAIELSTVVEKIIKELYDYESDVTKCITEINEIIDEQQKKDKAIVSAYEKAKDTQEKYNQMLSNLATYNRVNNNPEFKENKAIKEDANKNYASAKKAYNTAFTATVEQFKKAKNLPPSIGYDDLTMSR